MYLSVFAVNDLKFLRVNFVLGKHLCLLPENNSLFICSCNQSVLGIVFVVYPWFVFVFLLYFDEDLLRLLTVGAIAL